MMNLLAALFGSRHARLTPEQAARLAAWQALPEPDPHQALDRLRWVVVDVEASGLDMHRDHLISIGALAVQGQRIIFDDSFEVVLRQAQVSGTPNILVHEIGGTAQRGGRAPVDALLDFLTYLGKAPLVAFHAAFDEAMIGRAVRAQLGVRFHRPFLDLAHLAPALLPDAAQGRRALDDWLAPYAIRDFKRHHAVSDAYSTAQLFLVLLRVAQAAGWESSHDLFANERAQRALGRMRR
jgi:DNA polymerase III subunit epsilon